MVLSPGQKEKLRKGREILEDKSRIKLPLRVGDEITEPAEYAGVVTKISQDVWQNVSIQQPHNPDARKIILGETAAAMIKSGAMKFISKKERAGSKSE